MDKPYIKYSKTTHYKYRLEEAYEAQTDICPPENFENDEFAMDKSGLLLIKRLYPSDGPSGPTIDTASFMRGAFIHDVRAEAMRLGVLPPSFFAAINDELRQNCLQDGMCKFRADYVHFFVSITNNWCHKTTKPEHPILTAP